MLKKGSVKRGLIGVEPEFYLTSMSCFIDSFLFPETDKVIQ